MNGPEHYREAERLLEDAIIRGEIEEGHHDYAADRPSKGDHHDPDCEGHGNLAAAQVHATLALAAATAMATAGAPADGDTAHEWRELICVPKTRVTNGAAQ